MFHQKCPIKNVLSKMFPQKVPSEMFPQKCSIKNNPTKMFPQKVPSGNVPTKMFHTKII